ncbi:winged helix-turn-helix domain-containing protein, partial [Dokdonella sp.]
MTSETGVYRFGDVEVEPAAHRITRDGADLAVEPKAFAVLASLLEQPGKVLERDELLDRVWGHRHVTPGVLNRVVAQLRKALGDDAENPRYIQTLHGLGYRFIAEVHSNRER